jgi:hypothetical protein
MPQPFSPPSTSARLRGRSRFPLTSARLTCMHARCDTHMTRAHVRAHGRMQGPPLFACVCTLQQPGFRLCAWPVCVVPLASMSRPFLSSNECSTGLYLMPSCACTCSHTTCPVPASLPWHPPDSRKRPRTTTLYRVVLPLSPERRTMRTRPPPWLCRSSSSSHALHKQSMVAPPFSIPRTVIAACCTHVVTVAQSPWPSMSSAHRCCLLFPLPLVMASALPSSPYKNEHPSLVYPCCFLDPRHQLALVPPAASQPAAGAVRRRQSSPTVLSPRGTTGLG